MAELYSRPQSELQSTGAAPAPAQSQAISAGGFGPSKDSQSGVQEFQLPKTREQIVSDAGGKVKPDWQREQPAPRGSKGPTSQGDSGVKGYSAPEPAPTQDQSPEAKQAQQSGAKINSLGTYDEPYTYGGTGEKGTGFENFERYLNANAGTIKNTQNAWATQALEAQKSANQALDTGLADWQKDMTYTAGPSPEESANKRIEMAKSDADKAKANYDYLKKALIDTGINLSPEERASVEAARKEMERTADVLKNSGKGTAVDVTNATAAASTLRHQQDLAAARDFYQGEAAKKIDQTAQEAAARTKELTSGYEGIAGKSKAAGNSVGEAAFDAALLGSGTAGEQGRSTVKAGGEALGAHLADTKQNADAAQQQLLDQYQKALDQYNQYIGKAQVGPPPGAAAKKGPSKSFSDYFGPGGYVGHLLRAPFVNPQRLANTQMEGEPEWLKSIQNSIGSGFGLDNTNRGVGEEQNLAGLTGGALPGGQAYFDAHDEDVYNSMSDEEIHNLERMTPTEQHAWLAERRKQVRGG